MHTHLPRPKPNSRPRSDLAEARARTYGLALALVLLAFTLRTHQLAQKSLWLDEAFSVWISDQPLPDLLSWTVRIDQHPPLYYLVLRAWAFLGGRFASPTARAFWVRLPSAAFGTLTVAVFYALGRRFADRPAGLLAALLLALSPFHVWFGQEARMYALLALNASLATLGLARLFLPPRQLQTPLTSVIARPPQVARQSPHYRKERGQSVRHRLLRRVRSYPETVARQFLYTRISPSGDMGVSQRQTCADFASGLPLPPAKPAGETEGGRFGWALYILFTAATLWTHNTALLFWAATNLFFLAWLVLARTQETGCLALESPVSISSKQETGFLALGNPVSRLAIRWLLAQLAILLLWAPWLRPFLHQAAGVTREFWLPAPTWSAVGDALNTFLSAFLPSHAAWWGVAWLAFGVLFVAGACALRRKPARLVLLATLFLTPLAVELLVSLRRPIFYTRTLIGATLPLYLLLAAGAAALWRQGRHRTAARAAAGVALAMLLIANARSLHSYYTQFEKEAWAQAADHVSRQVQSGDLILYHASWVQLPFEVYFDPPASVSVVKHGLPVDLFDRGVLEPKMAEQDLPRLEALLQGHSRIWLVYSHNWYTDPQGLIPAALARAGALEERRRFAGIDVYRFKLPR
jgi:hypothetical protein